jgi:cystathionine gamma-synthase
VLRDALIAEHEDSYFPKDVRVLAHNCVDFVERVLKASASAEKIVLLLQGHPAIHSLYYPSLVATRPYYEVCKRRHGRYGFLISIIFHEPEVAVCFYDALDVRKGPSLGANFTLAIPYSQLAHFHELEWAAENGVPAHIVRISVGLEDEIELLRTVAVALGSVDEMRQQSKINHANKTGTLSAI